MVGKIYPSEKSTFRDPETGAEIVQYTKEGEINLTLYFTNRPYTSDGEHVVFLSTRTGRNEMFLLHLKSGKITQLTDNPGQRNVSSCLHPHRMELYFHDKKSLFRVRLDTLATEELLTVPEGYQLGILNLNSPPWLAFEISEQKSGMNRKADGQSVPFHSPMEPFFLRPLTLIYRFNVDDGTLECVWSDHRLLSHVQMSPTNPELLIFSDFAGYGAERVYYLNLHAYSKRTPRPLLGETSSSRGTHECFTRKGNLFLQWMEGPLRFDQESTLMHAFKDLNGVTLDNIESAPFRRYVLPERAPWMSHHFTMSEDEQWGLHDRFPGASTLEENMNCLSVFKHQEEEPQSTFLKLCFHNGAKGDRLKLGPEATLDNKDEWALYSSFLGGVSNICQVRMSPFREKLLGI